MSEHVTWEACPRCGWLAAVGWAPVAGIGSTPSHDQPVEFDCVDRCHVGLDELARAYGLRARRTPCGSAGEPGQ